LSYSLNLYFIVKITHLMDAAAGRTGAKRVRNARAGVGKGCRGRVRVRRVQMAVVCVSWERKWVRLVFLFMALNAGDAARRAARLLPLQGIARGGGGVRNRTAVGDGKKGGYFARAAVNAFGLGFGGLHRNRRSRSYRRSANSWSATARATSSQRSNAPAMSIPQTLSAESAPPAIWQTLSAESGSWPVFPPPVTLCPSALRRGRRGPRVLRVAPVTSACSGRLRSKCR